MKYELDLMQPPIVRDGLQYTYVLLGNHRIVAVFPFRTDAQKVCDLLNETSRSQGVYPKS